MEAGRGRHQEQNPAGRYREAQQAAPRHHRCGGITGSSASTSALLAPLGALLVLVLLCPGFASLSAAAAPSWKSVGRATISQGPAADPHLVFSPQGVPFTAAYTVSGPRLRGVMQAYVAERVTGLGWVSAADFTARPPSPLALGFDGNGVPHVAFKENAETPEQPSSLKVLKYSAGGDTWSQLGGKPLLENGDIANLNLQFSPANGRAFVAYTDGTAGSKATAWHWTGTGWTALGGPGFSGFQASQINLRITKAGVAIISYIAYGTFNGKTLDSRIVVQKYNPTKFAWERLGAATVWNNKVWSLAMALDSTGSPHLALDDQPAGGAHGLTVLKLGTTGAWSRLGPAGFLKSPDDYSLAVRLAMSTANVPYLAFAQSSTGMLGVRRWNSKTSSWLNVCGAAVTPKNSGYQAFDLALHPTSNVPYVAFVGEDAGYKLAVKRCI